MNDVAVKKRLLLIFSGEDAEMIKIKSALSEENYDVFGAAYDDMLYSVNKHYPLDAIVVDINPAQSGILEKCRQLRLQKKYKSTFIIFLSSNREEDLMVESLDAGVDFFLNKPVSINLLTNKINTAARWVTYAENVKVNERITVDKERYLVVCNGNNFYFPKKEFELLELLLSKTGKVFLRQEILHNVWKMDSNADGRTVHVHIHRIRQKIGGDMIKTVKGIGYKISV